MKQILIIYVLCAFLTLAFQIYVRYNLCSRINGCALSFAKGVVWSAIWPVSWFVYLKGM